jgi:thiol-disulfide isomerase/thioredoxin
MFLTDPIKYLESSDFDDDGNIMYSEILPSNKPLMILLQSNSCGYCNMAKPDFQRFAEFNKDRLTSATIQFDAAADPKFRSLNLNFTPEKVNNIYSGLRGFPSYVLYIGNTKYKYDGNRDFESLNNFIRNF